MEKITCYVVEDEPVSRSLLIYYISQVPDLHLVADFDNAAAAKKAFDAEAVDLLFLDINLGSGSGIQLAEEVGSAPVIVFTTASRDYAPEAFTLNAADYLVKPFDMDRFNKAIEKVRMVIDARKKSELEEETIFIKDARAMTKLSISEIQYVEALGDYLKLHTGERFYTMLGTMKQMEEKLKPFGFFRVHRSYLVALKYVNGVEGNNVIVGTQKVKVSDSNKADLLAILNPKRLM